MAARLSGENDQAALSAWRGIWPRRGDFDSKEPGVVHKFPTAKVLRSSNGTRAMNKLAIHSTRRGLSEIASI